MLLAEIAQLILVLEVILKKVAQVYVFKKKGLADKNAIILFKIEVLASPPTFR